MFKQLVFVLLLVLIATAKKHTPENDGMKCAKEKCPKQTNTCTADSKCKPTIQSCMAKLPDNATEKQINQFEACVKANKAAYDFMDCFIDKCGGDQKMNKHQRKTLHKIMKKLH